MRQYPQVVIDIYENSNVFPIVTHIFRGKTLSEAREYFKAHMKTDSFLRAAVNTGYYKDMRVKTEIKEVNGG